MYKQYVFTEQFKNKIFQVKNVFGSIVGVYSKLAERIIEQKQFFFHFSFNPNLQYSEKDRNFLSDKNFL